MNTTVKIALSLIPTNLHSQPLLLCMDDTMVAKYGTKFEEVSKLFDHAAHQGSSYLHGHCFVSLLLCIPVWKGERIHYLSLPLGYRMWQKTTSKLALAAQMVTQVMPELLSKRTILLCDSWYAYCANNPVMYYDPSGYDGVEGDKCGQDQKNDVDNKKDSVDDKVEIRDGETSYGKSSGKAAAFSDLP